MSPDQCVGVSGLYPPLNNWDFQNLLELPVTISSSGTPGRPLLDFAHDSPAAVSLLGK